MSKHLAMVCVLTGDHFLPTLHFARLAETTFTSGQAYKLIVQQERDAQGKARRTLEQNNKLWAMLGEISEQVEHGPGGFVGVSDKSWHGSRQYSPDEWKVMMMHACGQEVKFLP